MKLVNHIDRRRTRPSQSFVIFSSIQIFVIMGRKQASSHVYTLRYGKLHVIYFTYKYVTHKVLYEGPILLTVTYQLIASEHSSKHFSAISCFAELCRHFQFLYSKQLF